LTIAIAGAIGYVAWHIIPRSRTRAAAGSASFKPCKSRPSKFQPERTLDCVLRVSSHFLDRSKRAASGLSPTWRKSNCRISCGFSSKHQHGERADFHARDPHESAADLSCVNLHGFRLREADLRGAEISGAKLSKVDLSGADLSGADLTGADLPRVILDGANLGSIDLTGATDGSSFSEARGFEWGASALPIRAGRGWI